MTGPIELHAYDLDYTLYDSPRPVNGDPAWYFHAHSLEGWQPPGFDRRWILPTLMEARRSSNNPLARTVILTARPDHRPMRRVVEPLVWSTGIKWDAICLKPVMSVMTDAEYKARVLRRWVQAWPTLQKVVLYDDRPENIEAAKVAVEMEGRHYQGVLTPPRSSR